MPEEAKEGDVLEAKDRSKRGAFEFRGEVVFRTRTGRVRVPADDKNTIEHFTNMLSDPAYWEGFEDNGEWDRRNEQENFEVLFKEEM